MLAPYSQPLTLGLLSTAEIGYTRLVISHSSNLCRGRSCTSTELCPKSFPHVISLETTGISDRVEAVRRVRSCISAYWYEYRVVVPVSLIALSMAIP